MFPSMKLSGSEMIKIKKYDTVSLSQESESLLSLDSFSSLSEETRRAGDLWFHASEMSLKYVNKYKVIG